MLNVTIDDVHGPIGKSLLHRDVSEIASGSYALMILESHTVRVTFVQRRIRQRTFEVLPRRRLVPDVVQGYTNPSMAHGQIHRIRTTGSHAPEPLSNLERIGIPTLIAAIHPQPPMRPKPVIEIILFFGNLENSRPDSFHIRANATGVH